MKLSICVITMNRSTQLKEALSSCLKCQLPKNSQFIVIDNASTDDTEVSIKNLLNNCNYDYYYEKLPVNLGVGGGRNYAFEKASGEYVYMLDDDAVIDYENTPDFFIRAIEILDKNPTVVTMTTQIYDTAWEKNRVENNGPKISNELYKCLMFCGGSHFLRRSFYVTAPYLSNKYGYEELPPSLKASNEGKINAFCPELAIIHKPMLNKWDWNDERNHELLIKGIALPYAIKKTMYPKIATPLLNLAKRRRIKLYMKQINNAKRRVNDAATAFCKEYPIDMKIKVSTLIRLFKDFGLSTF